MARLLRPLPRRPPISKTLHVRQVPRCLLWQEPRHLASQLPWPRRSNSHAATDFNFFRDTSLGGTVPPGNASTVGETGVGTLGHSIFLTGNWYAAVSGNSGILTST